MWRKSQNGNAETKPAEVEYDYNSEVVYVRRNYEKVTVGSEKEQHECWQYEENKVPMKDWETFKNVLDHSAQLDDIEDAIVELAAAMTEV